MWASIFVCLVGLAAVALGSSGARPAWLRQLGASRAVSTARAVVTAPVRMARAWAAQSRIPRLSLDVKFKHLHELHLKRDAALQGGALVTSDADLVPGELRFGAETLAVRLRLDGSQVEALRGDKWPLAVHTRGDGQILGMRSFTLRAREIPGFRAEALWLARARSEDLLAVRTARVDLTLNGHHLGLMELAEIPSRELLESQQRRDGPVLGFDRPPPLDRAPIDAAQVASVLRPEAIARSRKLSRQRDTALRLLGAAFSGAIEPGDLFDPELFGRFIALSELWEAPQALAWWNVLLYANPLTARLEPIAHPSSPPRADEGSAVAGLAPFRAWLLSDRAIRAAYEAERTRLSRAGSPGPFAADLAEAGTRRTRLPLREDPRHVRSAPAAGSADVDEPDLPLPNPGLEEVLARHEFLRFEPDERMLVALPGRWDVAGWMILPDGVGLRIPAGTMLRFERRRGIIARGPLELLGEPDAPVVLEGPRARKRSQLWAGVYVLESARPSRWTHVTVRDTGGFQRHGWRLAGGVVFRKARVEIEDSTFRRSQSDDSLNIIRSPFVLRNVTIVGARGDAFDGDYVHGEISGGAIEGAGGDAIDVGGSRIAVRGVRIEDVRDKAIVIGERSRATIDDVTVEHVGIGVASKNGAETTLRGSSIVDVADVALTAYSSRSEYGPGLLTADGNRIFRAALDALAQSGSHISIDGEAVPPLDAAIDRLYKDGETDR